MGRVQSGRYLRRHRDLFGELWTSRELCEPGADARVQPRNRIARKGESVRVDELRNVEDA